MALISVCLSNPLVFVFIRLPNHLAFYFDLSALDEPVLRDSVQIDNVNEERVLKLPVCF